jgi:2'-5' RNA ligase
MRAAADEVPAVRARAGDLSGLGVDVPRALILAVADPSGGLHALRRRLDHELTERRIAYDRKSLKPHLTLGRAREQRGRGRGDRGGRGGAASIPTSPRPEVGPLSVTEFALIKSDLLPGGPRYEAVERVPLRQG